MISGEEISHFSGVLITANEGELSAPSVVRWGQFFDFSKHQSAIATPHIVTVQNA